MTIIHKAVAGGDGLDFVLSDATVDRYGDVVEPDGWDLKDFKKNPIALFGHNSNFPIGRWTDLRVEGGKLLGRLNLAKRGTSYRLDELIGLVEQGILRAVSVGFRPLKAEPLNPEKPYGPQRYLKQQLLETSLVSVPANPAALAVAKSMNVSPETMSLAFGEQAEIRRDMSAPGEQADTLTDPQERARVGHRSSPKGTTMKTISQRVIETEASIVAIDKTLETLLAADDLDNDAIDTANDQRDKLNRDLETLKRSEKAAAGVVAPVINRRPLGFPQKDVKPVDLLVRKAVVKAVSIFTEKPVEKVLEERYPGHEATEAIVKADPGIATTGGSHYVDDLQQISYQGFIEALDGRSVFPALRNSGLALNLDSAGTAYVPGVAAGGANGSFFAEGNPIRVGKITTDNRTLTSRKVGVIIAFSREAAKRSTPDLEALFSRRILADTAATIDSTLLDATDEDATRPGGLLYDQVASAAIAATASGYGGGDHVAVMEDFKALMQPFIDANAADGITVIMNPKQGLALDFMVGPDGALGDWFARARERFSFVESTHATAGRLIAVRAEDFASAVGSVEFEMSNQATLHMEDAAPAALSATGSPNTVAAPIRSLFQTDSKGIRMVMDINWRMMRAGMVRWINGTSW